MKQLFSILFAFLILLSGMHFSIATHQCGGKLKAVKFSLSEEKATCGMERSDRTIPINEGIASSCCHDKIAIYTVDNTTNPSACNTQIVAKNLLQAFIPINISLHSIDPSNSLSTYISPHNNLLTSAVSRVDICVFRI